MPPRPLSHLAPAGGVIRGDALAISEVRQMFVGSRLRSSLCTGVTQDELYHRDGSRARGLASALESLAPPAGLEPAPPAPEAGALSAELRGRLFEPTG